MARLCNLLGVSRSGFYAWSNRPASAHQQHDAVLKAALRQAHQGFQRAYGAPRLHQLLKQQGLACSRRRVARLMREIGIKPTTTKLYHWRPGHHQFYSAAGNQLREADKPTAPNQQWCGDFTHVRTHTGWLFHAVVLDRYSRRIVGWSFARRRSAAFTVSALRMAVRQHKPPSGCLFHSDQGIEYAAYEFQDALAEAGLERSMSRKATPLDNAEVESYFHTLKSELIHQHSYASDSHACAAITAYIAHYNHARLHSSLGYQSPVAYEKLSA